MKPFTPAILLAVLCVAAAVAAAWLQIISPPVP